MCSHILLCCELHPGCGRPPGRGIATTGYSAHQPDIWGASRQSFSMPNTDVRSHGSPQEHHHAAAS